jgi:hypothetical protein
MTRAKRPEDIEVEIAETRSDLAETLEALEDRLAPRQLIEKGFDMMRDGVNGNMGRIGQVLKENPIPLALIGAGLGWLMLSRTGATQQIGSAASDAAGAVGDRVRGLIGRGEGQYAHAWTKREDAARRSAVDMHGGSAQGGGESSAGMASRAYGAARETYGSVAETGGRAYGAVAGAAERVGDYGRQALDTAGDYADYAGRQVGQARDRFGQLMEDYPLAVGALGFLAGAVVAASLPATRWEDEYLGETRDDLWREAQSAGQEMVEKAKDVASTAASAATDAARDAVKETADAVKEEAERQGLAVGGEKKS